MKAIAIAVKGLKEITRDRRSLAMMLLFPAVFMLVFGFAFGAGGDQNSPIDIAVINKDKGVTLGQGEYGYYNFGEDFMQVLKNLTYENSTTPMFTLHEVSEEKAMNLLMKRKIACIVVIPEDFSLAIKAIINATLRESLTSLIGESIVESRENRNNSNLENISVFPLPEEENITAGVVIEGDLGYMDFGIAQSIVRGVLSDYIREIESKAKNQAIQSLIANISISREELTHVSFNIESISGTTQFTTFDYQAPGIMVFGLLIGSIGVSASLARESESQAIKRLGVSLMTSSDLLLGTLMSWTLIAVIQVLTLFGVAIIMGFHWIGGVSSLLVAIIIGLITGISCVSLGLLIASFSKNVSQAINLGMLVAVPMSFLIGAFFPIDLGSITAFLPWRQAFLALLNILSYGAQFRDAVGYVVAIIIETAVIFIVGVLMFSRNRLRAE